MADYKIEALKELARRELKKRSELNQPGWLERNANFAEQNINQPIESFGRAARDLIGGYGQGLANIGPGLYNLGASGINALGANIPKSPMIDIVPHSPSATAGDILSFFSGPGLLKAFGKAPEIMKLSQNAMKIPEIAQGIKHATNILGKSPLTSKIAGNAILGGAYSPDNPLLGMGLGAAGGLVGEGVNLGYSGLKNALGNNELLQKYISKFNPNAQKEFIENYLSGGTNNITKNSKELINAIRTAYNSRNAESKSFFDYVLGKAGNEKIYEPRSLILNSQDKSKSTLDKIKELNVGDLYNVFKSSPTLNNAHTLQSELGNMIGEIKNRAIKTGTERLELNKLRSAREQLKTDIEKFFERRDKNSNQPLGSHYKKGVELFRTNVAPYLEDKRISDIVRGGKTDVKNLHESFGTPSNKINNQGLEEIGSINKILEDLPEESRNRILFGAIGGNKLSPESLLKKLNNVKSKGYEHYFKPEIDEKIKILNQRIKNANRLKTAGKIAGAGTIASMGLNALNHLF